MLRLLVWKVIEIGLAGAIGTGVPCTTAQHDQCDMACKANAEPDEIVKKTRCEQTIVTHDGNPFPSLGIDCHCWLLEIESTPTQPEPTGPEA